MEGLGLIRMGTRWAALVGGALALAGCGRAAAPGAPEEQTAVFTRSDDLPLFTLQPVTPFEQDNFDLHGDQRCAFATSPALPPLVLATGFLRQPQGRVDVLVKYGGEVVEARLQTPGGFAALRDEATFDTGGMMIDVARIDVEPDGSGPAAPGRALLRMRMAGQEPQIIDGYWLCSV